MRTKWIVVIAVVVVIYLYVCLCVRPRLESLEKWPGSLVELNYVPVRGKASVQHDSTLGASSV